MPLDTFFHNLHLFSSFHILIFNLFPFHLFPIFLYILLIFTSFSKFSTFITSQTFLLSRLTNLPFTFILSSTEQWSLILPATPLKTFTQISPLKCPETSRDLSSLYLQPDRALSLPCILMNLSLP